MTCPWQFHGVDRAENPDGTVTLTLTGWNYTSNEQRKAGAGPVTRAEQPCLTRTVPLQFSEWDGQPVQVMESGTAAAMVREHVSEDYTVVWQGRGWTVEIRSDYPLWQMNG